MKYLNLNVKPDKRGGKLGYRTAVFSNSLDNNNQCTLYTTGGATCATRGMHSKD